MFALQNKLKLYPFPHAPLVSVAGPVLMVTPGLQPCRRVWRARHVTVPKTAPTNAPSATRRLACVSVALATQSTCTLVLVVSSNFAWLYISVPCMCIWFELIAFPFSYNALCTLL